MELEEYEARMKGCSCLAGVYGKHGVTSLDAPVLLIVRMICFYERHGR